jgi:predicted HicB family RNase H-like nuclease
MSYLSIRGINPDLSATLKQQAQASGRSVNQLVLDVLKEHTGQHKKAFHPGIP